jgi:hypothetical protein
LSSSALPGTINSLSAQNIIFTAQYYIHNPAQIAPLYLYSSNALYFMHFTFQAQIRTSILSLNSAQTAPLCSISQQTLYALHAFSHYKTALTHLHMHSSYDFLGTNHS